MTLEPIAYRLGNTDRYKGIVKYLDSAGKVKSIASTHKEFDSEVEARAAAYRIARSEARKFGMALAA